MKRLRQRILYAVLKKKKRPDDRTIIYLLNDKYITIRKQKDRRLRKTLKKLGVYNRRRYNRWMIPM